MEVSSGLMYEALCAYWTYTEQRQAMLLERLQFQPAGSVVTFLLPLGSYNSITVTIFGVGVVRQLKRFVRRSKIN